jgi:hypothetical protein
VKDVVNSDDGDREAHGSICLHWDDVLLRAPFSVCTPAGAPQAAIHEEVFGSTYYRVQSPMVSHWIADVCVQG